MDNIKSKNILTIDGGGARGVISLQFLKNLEESCNIKLHEHFDMFAGTSTGGLIAGLFAYRKISSKEILEKVYTVDNLQKIMYKSYYDKWFGLFQFRPKYTDEGKINIIEEFLLNKNSKTDKNNGDNDDTIYSVDKPILMTAYDPSEKKPILFRNYFDEPNYKLLDICNATSAAPTYFPAAKVTNLNTNAVKIYVDGGMCCNNPSNIAYLDSKKIFRNNKINIFSVGTGIAKSKFSHNCTGNLGGIEWLLQENIIDTILDGNQLMSHYCTKELANENKDNYIRINKFIKLSSGKIDDVSPTNYEYMIKEGDIWWNDYKNDVIKFFNN